MILLVLNEMNSGRNLPTTHDIFKFMRNTVINNKVCSIVLVRFTYMEIGKNCISKPCPNNICHGR